MNSKPKKVIKTIVNVILWVFLVFALVMTVLAFAAQSNTEPFPKIGKFCMFTVETDSMNGEDGFAAGDLIFSKSFSNDEKEKYKDLEVGEVITFTFEDARLDENKVHFNSHRIIEKKSDDSGNVYYVTKGDNVKTDQTELVYWDHVLAVWTGKKIVGVGHAIDFLQSPNGFLICVVIPLAIFFIYEIIVLVSAVFKLKSKGKKQITAADEELIKQRAVEEYLRQQAEAKANSEASEIKENVEEVKEEVKEEIKEAAEEIATEAADTDKAE